MNNDTEELQDIAVAGRQQHLTFTLAGEEYAVDVLKVREIRSWSSPTPFPHSPPHVLGAINLRGTIIPIVDLRRQFALDEQAFTSTTGVIVVQADVLGSERQIGLVVDRVLDVLKLDLVNSIESTTHSSIIGARYISGLSRSEDKLVMIVDLEAIIAASLADDEQGGSPMKRQ